MGALVTVPSEFSVDASYPNPFNSQVTTIVHLPIASALEVIVYNSLGQRVTTLANGLFTAGDHPFIFSAPDLASGTYYMHFTVPGRFEQVHRVMLVK